MDIFPPLGAHFLLEAVSKLPQSNNKTSDMEKSLINTDKTFVSNHKPTEITYPSKGTFDFPSFLISPKFASILKFLFFTVFSMRADKIYPSFFKIFTQGITIVGIISNQTHRSVFGPNRTLPGSFYFFKRLVYARDLRRGCRGNGASRRNTLAVDHHHPLRTFTSFGFSDTGPPFFAGAKLPSMNASSQSNNLFSSSSVRNLRHISSQRPLSYQSFSRRQQVAGLGYRLGRSSQRAPLRSTQRIPSKPSRFSVCGLPSFPGFGLGSKGSSLLHCSLLINRVVVAIGLPPIGLLHKMGLNV